MHRIGFMLAFFALALMNVSSAMAYDINPMVIELRPSGAGSSATVTVTNTHSVPIAIEVSAHKRIQKEDGSDTLIPETQDLIITPPQMIIPPGASQSIRVRWVGDAAPDHELAYRLVTEQLPIRLSKVTRNDRTADLTVKYRYEAALYIVPNGVKPSARLSGAEVISQDGAKMMKLTIVSDGTKRAILDAPKIKIVGSSGPITMEGDSLALLSGLNILPGSTRVVTVPAPAALAMGPVNASLESNYLFAR